MPGADASRGRIIYRPETVFAEAPPPNAVTTRVRFTRESLHHKNADVTSQEIRSDQQITDLILTGIDVDGAIDAELSYGNYDWMFEAALGGTWAANVLRNGTTKRSFTIEKGFMDIGKFIQYRGCVVNSLDIDVTSRRIVTLVANFMGSQAFTASASMAGTTTPTEPNSNQVIGAGPDIKLANSGGTFIELSDVQTKEVKLSIKRNLRLRDLATQPQTDDFGYGFMDITGTLLAYFKDLTDYNGFLANAFFSLQFSISDPADNTKSYRVTLPQLKLPDANPTLAGVASDVMMPISFQAVYDAAVGYTINFERAVTIP